MKLLNMQISFKLQAKKKDFQAASDADGDVRNAILQVTAAVWRCIGEAAVKRIFAQIAEDKIKLDKVKSIILFWKFAVSTVFS